MNVGLVCYVWLEVVAYHASTEMIPIYLMILSIRTKYVLNFYVLINIYTGISLRISKLPQIISRARILLSYSWAWYTVILDIVNDMISVIVSRAEKFAAKSKLRSFICREICFRVRRGCIIFWKLCFVTMLITLFLSLMFHVSFWF